jgi:hypothetical protein
MYNVQKTLKKHTDSQTANEYILNYVSFLVLYIYISNANDLCINHFISVATTYNFRGFFSHNIHSCMFEIQSLYLYKKHSHRNFSEFEKIEIKEMAKLTIDLNIYFKKIKGIYTNLAFSEKIWKVFHRVGAYAGHVVVLFVVVLMTQRLDSILNVVGYLHANFHAQAEFLGKHLGQFD